VLPTRRTGIDTAGDVGSVIIDPLDHAGLRKCRTAHGLDVEPLVRRALKRPVSTG
jgi:hypothetical protein